VQYQACRFGLIGIVRTVHRASNPDNSDDDLRVSGKSKNSLRKEDRESHETLPARPYS